jgi:hypothetical protein
VDRLIEDLDIAAKDVAEQLNQELAVANIKLPDPATMYPHSPEVVEAASDWISSRAVTIQEKYDQHLLPFVDNDLQLGYAFEYLSWRGREPIDVILGAALLPRLISAFEEFLGALVRTGLTLHAEALGPYGDVPFELTNRYPDVRDIRALYDRQEGCLFY